MIDLAKLSAPWRVVASELNACVVDANEYIVLSNIPHDIANKIALWRNALDVQIEMGWGVRKSGERWVALNNRGREVWSDAMGDPTIEKPFHLLEITCPLEALVETRKWYRENCEKGGS